MIVVWFITLSLNLGFILGEYGPTVTLPDGKLVGTVNQTIGENMTYYAFRGIPYAQKPVGNLRFANPVKNDAWNGTLNATRDKDACTQLPSSASTSTDDIIGSEDCLHINVYTSDLNGSLPVMVWIYGGGFTRGSAAYDWYGPDYLLEKGVVYVSLNYRLGIFGFLSTDDSIAYGNWGLKDQILALKWVQDNIQYFGGDPSQVTIFGQSAGSASVSYLLTSGLTKGLYQRAIMESGTSLCSWALSRNARTKAFKIGRVLGIVALTSKTLINKLRKIDYKALKLAEGKVSLAALLKDNILEGLPIGVVKERSHSEAVFSGKSYELLEEGNFQNVTLIVGYNSNEMGALTDYINYVRPAFALYDADNSRLAPSDLTTSSAKKLIAGATIKNKYLGSTVATSNSNDLIHFASNDQFNRPVREFARLTSVYVKAYLYMFDYKGSLGAENTTYSGVGHSEDLNYLFVSPNHATAEDIVTRNKILKMWTNFAIYGNPTPVKNDTTLDSVAWEPNTPLDNASVTIKYLYINTTLSMKTNPDQEDWEYYQNIYKTNGGDSYSTY